MTKESLEIEVAGGLCTITFVPWVATGPSGSDTSPGIGFKLQSDRPCLTSGGKHFHGNGVIGRADAARLRDMLELFLKNHANGIDD